MVDKLLVIQKSMETDEDDQQLLQEYHLLNKEDHKLFCTLPPHQRDLLIDYSGVCGEMHRKMLIFACKQ